MKKFEVLETHQGDKLYVPGDPETGTRIAEPTEVQHLVDLGLLKEVSDADETDEADRTSIVENGITFQPITSPEDAKTIADLRQQVETLTKERDDARTEATAISDKLAALNKPADSPEKSADESAPVTGRRARGDK